MGHPGSGASVLPLLLQLQHAHPGVLLLLLLLLMLLLLMMILLLLSCCLWRNGNFVLSL